MNDKCVENRMDEIYERIQNDKVFVEAVRKLQLRQCVEKSIAHTERANKEWATFLGDDYSKPLAHAIQVIQTIRPTQTLIITAKELKQTEYHGNIVYYWIKKNDILYIGKSHKGLDRIKKSHDHIRKSELEDNDIFYVSCFETEEEASKVEWASIRLMMPQHNAEWRGGARRNPCDYCAFVCH